MKIKWSFLAFDSYQNICLYILENFGYRVECEYREEVDKMVNEIAKHPNLGRQEFELASDGSIRSISVRKLSKIVYFVENDALHIADVWSTRQDPNLLKKQFEN